MSKIIVLHERTYVFNGKRMAITGKNLNKVRWLQPLKHGASFIPYPYAQETRLQLSKR